MIRTYTETWTMSNAKLQKATFKVDIFENTKYEDENPIATAEYTGIKAWSIIEGGEEAEEIESMTDANSVDENHEYLVLHFADGRTGTFRNSHVDLRIR